MSDFPKGWPIRCPECDSWSFHFHSERTGNIRIYTCRVCEARYRATWKGNHKIRNVLVEPKNCKMEDFEWEKAPANTQGSLTLFEDGEQI